MSEKLLSEYQCVLRELEMIKNRAVVIKDVTQDRLKCAKNDEEKENIFIDFKTQLRKIKKDKNIKQKYKNLVKRKEYIETEMLDKMSEEKKHIPSVKNSKLKPTKHYKVDLESSSSESDNYIDINVDVCDDLVNLINKYKKKITFDELSPKKNRNKNKKNSPECLKSVDENNTTIIVNVPTNCNNSGSVNNNSKKNPYMDSESYSDEVVSIPKKSCQQTKHCLDDTYQVKKLYNLIKDLQCEIDR